MANSMQALRSVISGNAGQLAIGSGPIIKRNKGANGSLVYHLRSAYSAARNSPSAWLTKSGFSIEEM